MEPQAVEIRFDGQQQFAMYSVQKSNSSSHCSKYKAATYHIIPNLLCWNALNVLWFNSCLFLHVT